jgi:Ca2+-binding RTX toxin-like protein
LNVCRISAVDITRLNKGTRIKRVLLLALLIVGCSTQPPAVESAKPDKDNIEHPVVRTPLTEVGTNGNDDLVAPFSRFQQDTVYGLNGQDEQFGEKGDDQLYGGNGQDRILGDYDEDYIVGGDGRDYLSGNAHADTIEAADGQKDTVYCGSGERDGASVDKGDTVDGCETVNGKPAK